MGPLIQFKNLKQFTKLFNEDNEELCKQYLIDHINKDGLKCSHCGNSKLYYIEYHSRYKCSCCKKQQSIYKGTIFEGTKLPLSTWFLAIYLVVVAKKGISSIELADMIDVTQKSAWYMMHRIRLALKPAKRCLKNTVECDETYVGGRRRGSKRGRGGEHKVPVFGMVERDGELIAYVVENCKRQTLWPILFENLELGCELMTDDFRVYRGLLKYYDHFVINHTTKQYSIGRIHTNTIEGFWSWLKKAIRGTFHFVSKQHLQKYVDEFVMKYNTRKMSIQQRFDITISNVGIEITYQSLIGNC